MYYPQLDFDWMMSLIFDYWQKGSSYFLTGRVMEIGKIIVEPVFPYLAYIHSVDNRRDF